MNDRELATLIEGKISASVGYYDSELSQERGDILKYYQGDKPAPYHKGNSKYVSLDVYDAVEGAKAILLEAFAAGEGIIKFAPQNADDTKMAEICSEYTNYVIFRQNPGYEIFESVIHDGLLSRAAVAKVYWREQYETTQEVLDGVDPEEVTQYVADPEVDISEWRDKPDGTVKATLTRKRDTSQVCIDPVAPEEFLISRWAKSIKDADFVGHRFSMTWEEMQNEGFDMDKVKRIPADHKDLSFEGGDERYARHSETSDALQEDGLFNDGKGKKSYWVTEAYTRLDLDDTGETMLWKVITTGTEILHKEIVDRIPFIPFTPIPVPHTFWGSSFAGRVMKTQDAKTVLTRGILDHTVITNNPRTVVVQGGLSNPQELLDNRIGGIINVKRPDSILPYPQAGMNPFVFETIKLLDMDKETRTGVSQLSQGLNKDAVSKQNSQGMVEQMTNLSMQRLKIIARNFAEQFLKPLALEVYQLVIENEEQDRIVQLAGEYVPVNPSDWKERRDVSVELHLGIGERDRRAAEMVEIYQGLAADPMIGPMFGPNERYEIIKKWLDLKGYKDTDRYIKHPTKVEPEEPSQAEQQEMQIKEREMAVKEQEVQLKAQDMQLKNQIEQMRLELDRMRLEMDRMFTAQSETRKDFEAETRVEIAEEELAIAKATPEGENKKAIISPNS